MAELHFGNDPSATTSPASEEVRQDLAELATSQLAHALDARHRGLKVYESLKSLNDVIGTQYGDRVLFELVQNAHDAHSQGERGEIAIRLVLDAEDQSELLVGNKGRPFSTSNLNAIRNIGTSDKQIGEGIGNKGLGFRSVEALTDDVRIYSSNGAGSAERFGGYCFRFATLDEIAAGLVRLGAAADIAKDVAPNIPRYLVPVRVAEQSGAVLQLAREGFSTVVALPLKSPEAIELARRQVDAMVDSEAPVLLFLDRIAVLDVSITARGEPTINRRLTRTVDPLATNTILGDVSLSRIVLDDQDSYLVARRTLSKQPLLEAVKSSLSVAPPLKRWLDWRGDALVSVAVPLTGVKASGRLFNFLPMDDMSKSPIVGHVDAPFFADIDRRSMKADLPLNKHLLEAASSTAAAAALAIVDGNLDLPETAAVDLASWSAPHMQKIIAAFAGMGRPLTSAAIWPVVSDGDAKWAGFDTLYSWPDIRTRHLTPLRLAEIAGANILLPALGEERIARAKALASMVSLPLAPTEQVLCEWTETVAEHLTGDRRWSPSRWRSFYEDIVTLFAVAGTRLASLEGKKIFIDNDGKPLVATAKGVAAAPPVFVRVKTAKGRRGDGPPSPPPSLARKFRFLHERIELGDAIQRGFEKAGLLRRYDPVEILGGIKGALGDTPTELQRREALLWSFKVWRAGGGKPVEDALRGASIFLPTLGGWHHASEALPSSTWTPLGRTLEQYLHEAGPHSPDCAGQRERLLVSFAEWPRASSDDRKEDWFRFLVLLGLSDGLKPIAGDIRRVGTPSGYWNHVFSSGKEALGLNARWTARMRDTFLENPQTDYHLRGEIWRLPGQLEHSVLPQTAKECLSELVVAYVREQGVRDFTFSVEHWRGWNKVEAPTPLAVFLHDAPWVANLRRDDVAFAPPEASWSTTAARQIPPRFVARFAAEPGSRASLPATLFDTRIGLRDWSAQQFAPQRLASLADALDDLSAAERRDLRDQLRRAWGDVAEAKLILPTTLPLVIERSGGLEICAPDAQARPVVHVTSERQGFAARALADRGEAVLDVGEADAEVLRNLIEATGVFSARLADAGDVRLVIDGADFEVDAGDSLLVTGSLAWLADAAVFAHEYLGDALELRTLPPDELERRLRQVRLRRCGRFVLVIADHEVPARGDDRVQPVAHAKWPTLVVVGGGDLDLDLLIEAAPALTKLMGARRNTLEQMLGRLMREGFVGGATGPSEEQYARAIRRDVAIVRDHFAATRGGIERRVHALVPVIAHIASRVAAERLIERYDRLGSSLNLRAWLAGELGPELAEQCLAAVEDIDDQVMIRRRMNFDFAAYGLTLAALGYPPLNDEADFYRLFQVYLAELRPALLDRLRRRYASTWHQGLDLADYVALRRLEFISFDPAWPQQLETLDRETVVARVSTAADASLGPDDPSVTIPDLEPTSASNRKLIHTRHSRLAGLIRAWCRKNGRDRPSLMDAADPQPLVRVLDGAGYLDFEILKTGMLPALYRRISAWPDGMPASEELAALSLEPADLEHEEREAREVKRKADVDRRTIKFAGMPLDTGGDDFAHLFEGLADAALANGPEWYARSRPPRLIKQEQRDGASGPGKIGGGGGKGQAWQNQPPESIRKAMGIASEWLAREYLRRRHPREMSDECWVSSNRAAFCSGDEGYDGHGYDFKVVTTRNEWLYEVKSALDEGGEFEFSARELEVAGSASLERKRRYRILYVPFVFDPSRWRVMPLSNPAASETRDRFKVVRSGSVRYRFETR
ncbi:sacsin N-terminal ATP-binding-like domain-containing protein [Aurantimonas marina]|uniref:sacsin N-terminal ATP-binding-like domain-containing protein n=1 Tax=Aurantimonas marina TaxID=2780508 RepID=UPI0019D2A16F|nr:DUF3883 domain-containing protein [Aurantimonas marina]